MSLGELMHRAHVRSNASACLRAGSHPAGPCMTVPPVQMPEQCTFELLQLCTRDSKPLSFPAPRACCSRHA